MNIWFIATCFVPLVLSAAAAGNTITIHEVDNATQADRAITLGRVFAQGEIAQCPQPVLAGTPDTPISNYQADVKNRWSDGSVKFAIISFTQTLKARGSTLVNFRNAASCNNTGYLTGEQMANFNGGKWGAGIQVTAGGVTKSADARTLLSASDPAKGAACRNQYWLRGPVVTQVIVQDCTPPFPHDFGWHWDGAAMTDDPSPRYQSLHPVFILTFYPATNNVKVDYILENMWSGKLQDQQYSFVLQSGSPPQAVYSHKTFKHIARTRWRKTFWSGNEARNIRIDHNFAYLTSTKALPNYDLHMSVDPSRDYKSFSDGDKGDIAGKGVDAEWGPGYSNNHEGAPIQREDLEYLYNMGSCGKANGACAKALYILTGERGDIDKSLAPSVPGGAGTWNNQGNIPYHMRESRSGGSFYCPGYADKDAMPSTTCGAGAGDPTGRPLSRHAHPQEQMSDAILPVAPVGSYSLSGWTIAGCSHWLDYSYVPYLLTGDYYYLDEEYQGASYCMAAVNATIAPGGGGGFYGYINPLASVIREFAWGMQTLARAAFLAVDGTPESLYYNAMVSSNMEVEEGLMGITGTSLTPDRVNSGCSAYDFNRANRWDWGRCTHASLCTNRHCTPIAIGLHSVVAGGCLRGKNPMVDSTKATDVDQAWQYWFLVIALGHLQELGFSQVNPVATQTQQRLIEMVLDPGFNPYLAAAYLEGIKNGPAECSGSSTMNPFFTSWAQVLDAFVPAAQAIKTFEFHPSSGNYPCADHGYSLLARAAGTYITKTASGSFSGSAAWNWLKAKAPYSVCGDSIIKFALAPR